MFFVKLIFKLRLVSLLLVKRRSSYAALFMNTCLSYTNRDETLLLICPHAQNSNLVSSIADKKLAEMPVQYRALCTAVQSALDRRFEVLLHEM